MRQALVTMPLPTPVSVGLLLLRVVAGAAFMLHGSGKMEHPFSWAGPGSHIPGLFLALAAISEFGGGLAWILGLLTPLASFGLACTMTVATWIHAVSRGDPFVARKGGPSYELAVLYLTVAILLMLVGPGRYSVDRLVFGEKRS